MKKNSAAAKSKWSANCAKCAKPTNHVYFIGKNKVLCSKCYDDYKTDENHVQRTGDETI